MSRREKGIATLLAAILTALWLFFTPGCPIRNATGIPCPGCGMSRAWLAVLRLDVPEAFRCHPMFWAVPVFFWLFWKDFRPFRRRWRNAAAVILLTAGLVVCWLIRLKLHLIV